MPETRAPRSAARSRSIRGLALGLPLAALALVDLGLRAASVLPPDDPLLFYARTGAPDFSPFATHEDGTVAIADAWTNPGNELRGRLGRGGRQFLYPGFRAAHFAKHPGDAIRIFALGGSTTFGLYVGAGSAFPAVIERNLEAITSGRKVEVVNLGCAGWASDRVANVLPAVFGFEPDLLIVYTGHNEMLAGHIGAGSGLSFAAGLRVRLIRVSALFAWLNHAIASILRPGETAALQEEVAAIEGGSIPTYEPRALQPWERSLPGPEFFGRAERDYALNLHAIVAAATEAGVPLLLVLPVTNLLVAPSLSAHGEDFDAERAFRAAERTANALLAEGRLDAALPELERAAELSPRHALARHRLGMALLESGRTEEAMRELQNANDRDVRTHRMTRALESALIEVAEETGTRWVDLRPAFRASLEAETAETLFVDHLHPTSRGHELIAAELMPSIVALLEAR